MSSLPSIADYKYELAKISRHQNLIMNLA